MKAHLFASMGSSARELSVASVGAEPTRFGKVSLWQQLARLPGLIFGDNCLTTFHSSAAHNFNQLPSTREGSRRV
jgi:hypothetical protein